MWCTRHAMAQAHHTPPKPVGQVACLRGDLIWYWPATVQAPASSQQLPRRSEGSPGRPESCQQRPAAAHLPRQQFVCQPLGRLAVQYTTVDCSTALQLALLPIHYQKHASTFT